MNYKIKAIFFDIGGVLYNENISKNNKNLKKFTNYYDFLKFRKRYIQLAQTNKISSDEYFCLISKKLNIDKDYFMNSYLQARKESIILNKSVEKIIKKLKKSYLIGTLTNITSFNHKLRLKKKVYQHFKLKLISCKECLRKPDIKFYKLIIKKTKLLPEQVIFIDDEKEMLLPAKKLGINTILFKNSSQLKNNLKNFGIKI
jgi:epoxide hydrolase-like predicted phosphatase